MIVQKKMYIIKFAIKYQKSIKFVYIPYAFIYIGIFDILKKSDYNVNFSNKCRDISNLYNFNEFIVF